MNTPRNDFASFTNNYMNVLLGMSDDTKLRIIRLLMDSLLECKKNETHSPSYTHDMLKKHAGAWVGNETTDKIMSDIRENSSIRKPLEL